MSAGTERRVNIADPDFRHFPEFPDGFRPGIVRLGALVGATNTGISVYELPPGQAIAPYHYENPEDEWLLVLAGRPTWRHPGGEDELAQMDVVFFPPGPDGAHMVRNDTDSTARVLMFSNVSKVAATVYPDSDKIAIWTGNDDDDLVVKRTSGVRYWEDEGSNPPVRLTVDDALASDLPLGHSLEASTTRLRPLGVYRRLRGTRARHRWLRPTYPSLKRARPSCSRSMRACRRVGSG